MDDDLASAELISQLDADVLVIANNTEDETEFERLLTDQELFGKLQAARDGHVAVLHMSDDGYRFDGEEHTGNPPGRSPRADRSASSGPPSS